MRHLIRATALLACCAAPAVGDVIHTRGGRDVTGRVHRLDAYEWVVYAPDRRATFVNVADVASIEITARPATDPAAAAQRLASLRRSVAALADPAQAVARYQQFLHVGADPATLAEARDDLAVWQDRADRHLTRLGDHWVTPADQARATAEALSDARQARELLKQGRPADADPLVAAALAIDPRNVPALYLAGLLRCQQNQLSAAAGAFEAVAAAVPNHAPTLNNLAVIAWQQHRYLDALARYDQAMTCAPANPLVLDNVAAALSAVPELPPFVARSPVVDRVTRRFQQQDQRLAARMTALGLHPFGRSWLTDADMGAVHQAQQLDQAQLNTLTADFDRVQDAIRQTDLTIAAVEIQRRRATPSLPGPWLASYDGGDEPPVSLELRNDADQLQRRRATQVAQLDRIQRQAQAIRRRMSGQPDGVQRSVGPEGTPLQLPTTRPAS